MEKLLGELSRANRAPPLEQSSTFSGVTRFDTPPFGRRPRAFPQNFSLLRSTPSGPLQGCHDP